jgi:hypothetical protein
LLELIPRESLRPLLQQGNTYERKNTAGGKWIDPLILFKMVVLQQTFNLSDEVLEFCDLVKMLRRENYYCQKTGLAWGCISQVSNILVKWLCRTVKYGEVYVRAY